MSINKTMINETLNESVLGPQVNHDQKVPAAVSTPSNQEHEVLLKKRS